MSAFVLSAPLSSNTSSYIPSFTNNAIAPPLHRIRSNVVPVVAPIRRATRIAAQPRMAGDGVVVSGVQDTQKAQLEELRRVYKAAKAAYKETKKSGSMDATALQQLEVAYRAAKTDYKGLKAEVKGKRMVEMADAGVDSGSEDEGVPEYRVCGGKTCMRMGAQAVATILLGKNGVADGVCQKRCGGVGPTVSVRGLAKPVKVNIKSAVKEAIADANADSNTSR